MADNVTGIVLDIPADVLNNIKNADKAIKDLEKTSKDAASNIKRDFNTTMVGGVEAFIKKVQEAQSKLNNLKMPTIDASGLSSAIQALSQAMATIDKSATTGSNRLTRIANAMTALQTSNPDPQMFQTIADGISKIGNTSQQTIDNVRTLGQVMAQLARDIRTVQQAQQTQNANTATAAQYNKIFREQADLVRRINEIKAKGADADGRDLTLLDRMRARYDEINQQLDKLNRKKQTAASELAMTQGYNRVGDAQARTDVSGSINYAKQAKSLNDLQAAYKNLKAVMATVDPKTSAWQQMNAVLGQTRTRIDEIKKSMGKFKSHASQVGDVAGQLQYRLAAAFSVASIIGFINKMVNVRSEFELQNTTLRAILQNKDEADKIFMQVQQMALQSPFTIMQMTTYTKQLAAYRIEADKLVGTTKMLADVSAGLGVDMNRLILAYGQVKAANYLRACLGKGTRVKMFDGSFKNVEDVVVGDVLMGDDEQPRNVSKLYQGEQQMYRVSYLGGAFRCNEHHILTVYDALKMRVSDVFVLDYLKEPYRYHGVKRIDGEYKTFIMKVEPDNIDTYYGFSIDGNHRFIIEDNIVTHNTEVRQFTEAGLNIAGELANYFSELQGRMVSVGEVMQMITNRMVRFEDVEEVFKRVTSAGGLFYDLQKKQSETLWGQLQRIKDAMNVMFNDIGKDSEGAIMAVVKGIRSLLENWRVLAKKLKLIVISWGAYKVAVMLAKVANTDFVKALANAQLRIIGQGKALGNAAISANVFTNAIKTVETALKGLAALTIPTLLIEGLTYLINKMMEASAKAEALQEEFDRIGEESLGDLNGSIANFARLADIITDSSKTYTEHQEAVDELKRSYGEIIPEQKLSAEYIKSLNGNYQELTDTITKYYQSAEYQKKYEAVMASDYYKDLQEEVEDILQEANKRGDFKFVLPEPQIKDWANKIAEELASGKLPATLDALDKRVTEIFDKNKIKEAYNNFDDVIDAAKELQSALGDISLATSHSADAYTGYFESMQLSTETYGKSLSKLQRKIAELPRQIESLQQQVNDRRQGGAMAWFLAFSETNLSEDVENLAKYKKELKSAKVELENILVARSNLVAQNFANTIDEESKTLTKDVRAWWKLRQQLNSLALVGETSGKRVDELTKRMNDAEAAAQKTAKTFDTEVDFEMLKTIRTTNDLNKQLDIIAQSAFPTIAASAVKNMSEADKAIFKSDKAVTEFITKLQSILPSGWGVNFAEWGNSLGSAFTLLANKLKGVKVEAEDTAETVADIYSRRAIANVDKFGADMSKINAILDQQSDSPREMAESLRGAAKQWEEYLISFKKSTNQEAWLKLNVKTREELAQMTKDVKAARALADEIWAEDTKGGGAGRGEDAVLKRWQDRKKAIEDTAKAYEEYRKSFNKSEADKMIAEQYDKIYSKLGVRMSDYYKDGVFDTQALINALKTLEGQLDATTEARIKALNDLRLEYEGKGIELKVKLAEQGEKDLKAEINRMFANYELTKALGNLGLNVDLTYMVGGKPMTLDDIRKKLAELRAADDGSEGAKNRIKIYEEAEKKITDMENKAAVKRLENYNKYLLESMSERVRIELETQQKISKIRQSEELDEFSKNSAIAQAKKKMQEELTKFDFDQFKGSDVYIETFKDLERASKEQLQYVIDRLKALQSATKDLSPIQVKSIAQEIKKVQDALGQRTSFTEIGKNFVDSLKYAKQRNALIAEQVNLQNQLKVSQGQLSVAEKRLFDMTVKRDAIKDKNSDEWKKANVEVEIQQTMVSSISGQVNTISNALENVTEKISKGEQAWANFSGAIAKTRDKINQASDAVSSIFEGLDSMGLVSDSMRDGLESMSEILSGIDKTMDGLASIDLTRPFSVVTGIGKTLGGVFSTIGGIFGIGDKKKERQIKRLQEKVEHLEKSYEKLGQEIARAYAYDDYKMGYEQSLKNIDERKRAIQEQIALEQAKKKTDKNKVKEYQDALDQLAEDERALRNQFYEDWGSYSIDSLKSAGEEWTSAWLDAYKETGDGLDALTDKWDDFFENLLLKQASSAVVNRKLKKYIESINAVLDTTGLSEKETSARIKEIIDSAKAEAGTWNEQLKEWFSAFGGKGGQGSLLLSDLQKGIQNITEPQAAAIEAYLNSMRFAVFEQNNILTNMLTAIQSQYGSSTDNPILSEVKAIRSLVASIDDRLSRVIVPRNSIASSYVVKVN